MVGGISCSWLALAMSAAAASVPFGCGESKSSSSNPSATGGASAAAGNGSGGTIVGGGGLGATSGASSGGATTCPIGGSGAAGSGDGGQAGDGSVLACDLIVYPSRVYGPECQAWMEENCCPLLEACAASPSCKTLVDCVNACYPATEACLGCCDRGLVAVPAELEAIAACTKSGAVMPDGCNWPPSTRP
jgi:hypothetical protein